ncbi:hypothetical protein ACQ4PT_020790 [Festuca glaucescens]
MVTFLLLLHIAVTIAAGDATTLTATPATITRSDQWITLRWSSLPSPTPLDYIAVYSPPSSADLDYLGFLFLNASASWATGAGTLVLPRLPDLRAPYQFRLFRSPPGEPSTNTRLDQDHDPLPDASHRGAVSGHVRAEGNGSRPAQVHLAFADAPDEMRVLFVCDDAGNRAVRYGLLGRREEEWEEAPAEARTYERRQMCGYPANDIVGWRDPGFVFDAVMKGLQPGRRYFYKVGSDSGGWSEKYSFISRDIEANETIAFFVWRPGNLRSLQHLLPDTSREFVDSEVDPS